MGYTFLPQATYAAGSNPISVTTADVDGDGRDDLIIGNLTGNNVSVLLGTANGTFLPQATYAIGVRSLSVTTADVNEDGRADIIAANQNGSSVSVLLGTAIGTFLPQATFAAGSSPSSVTVADVNRDGHADLITANQGVSDTVAVMLGNGAGSFGAPATFAIESFSFSQSVTTADVNGDGRTDIITANTFPGHVSVLLGNGNGTFGPQTTFAAGDDPWSVTTADVNHDGRIDLITANQQSNNVSVLLGNGDGTFQAQATFAVGGIPTSVTVADVNHDGHADLLTANQSSNTVSMLLGNGDGTFGAQVTFAAGIQPVSVTTTDVNHDGQLDLIVANLGNNVSVLLGRTTMAATSVTATSPEPAGTPLGIGDVLPFEVAIDLSLDGLFSGPGGALPTLSLSNGGTATFTGNSFNGDTLYFSYTVQAGQDTADLVATGLNLNGATLSHTATVGFAETTISASIGPASVTTADLNNDGQLDLITADLSDTVSVRLANGDGTYGARSTYSVSSVGLSPNSVTTADVNGDGRADLIVGSDRSDNVSVLLGNGDGTFGTPTTFAAGNGAYEVTTADLNHDGRIDLITANQFDTNVSVLLGNGNGTFGPQTTFAVGINPKSVKTADVNGDGRADLIVANQQSNNVSVLLGVGDGTFGPQSTFATGSRPNSVTTADVNNDGDVDLITVNGLGNTVSVLLGNGDGTFSTQPAFAVGSSPVSVATADVDHDGNIDIIAANSIDDSVSVLLGNGDGTFGGQIQIPLLGGVTPFSVTTGDVDGDGRVDLITANTFANTVSVLRNLSIPAASLDAASFLGASGRDTGIAVDTTAPTTTIASIAFSNDTGAFGDFITSIAAQTISGTASANIQAGEHVEVSLDNGNTWTAATTTVGQNTWSLAGVTLVGSDTLRVRVTDLAGNSGTAAIQAYVLDTTAPTTSIVTLSFSDDTGASSTDFITRIAAQTITGTADANFQAGETLWVSFDNGATWTSIPIFAGTNAWSIPNATLAHSDTFKARLTDQAGNEGPTFSQAYVLDTTAPTATIVVADSSLNAGETSLVTITFSEAVTGFTNADLTIANGALSPVSSSDGGITWTATLTPAVDVIDATNVITLDNSGIADLAGNTGGGTTDSNNYAIDTLVNDPPVNTVPGAQTVNANAALAIAGLSVSDSDAGASAITTTLSVGHGILTVASAGGAAVAGTGTGTVTLTGTVAQINVTLAAVNNVVYAGTHDFFGADTLTVTTNDGGHTGAGGALADVDQVAITVGTVVPGTSGPDSFNAPAGTVRIDGGAGVDIVTFGFRLVDATVSYLGNTIVVDGPTGSHTVLTGFEVFAFTDGTVNNADGSPLVDDLFYYSKYHDVWNAHADADAHYNSVGWHEGRDPDAFFSTVIYLSANPDVKAAGINPLTHFDTSGWTEGRVPSITFDPAAYLAANPDVAATGIDPLRHYLAFGYQEGRQPIAPSELIGATGFDYVYYLQHNPDVAAANVDPFQHFQQFGWKEGRNPNALFDVNGYLNTYADVKASNVNPLDHYNQFGWHEGRDPSVGFDTTSYLTAYADIAAANINPLTHFLHYGIHEGRSAFADGVWG